MAIIHLFSPIFLILLIYTSGISLKYLFHAVSEISVFRLFKLRVIAKRLLRCPLSRFQYVHVPGKVSYLEFRQAVLT